MMLADFLLLLLLTGGCTANSLEQPELLDDQLEKYQSSGEGGSTSNNSEQIELSDDYLYYFEDIAEDEVAFKIPCGYHDVINYLNLTTNKELYTTSRPVKNFKDITRVYLTMEIDDILDVREIDQTLVLSVWIYMGWKNSHIMWFPPDFCGLHHIVVPTELLWKPDLIIEEVTEKNKAPLSPYISVRWHGTVEATNNHVLVSTCRMQIYKFPFDIQSCRLSFKSALHNDKEIKFEAIVDTSEIEMMENQYEWLFINMTVAQKTVKQRTINDFKYNQSVIVYKITMKRQSVLYIANFILPILFFFCLDLASFLISDRGGEKLSFKVTVLLAVTVMQLILNDILPSSDRIPLIVVYCIGIFGLMMLNLMETILVMYLVEKDFAPQDNEANNDQSPSEDCEDKEGKDNIHNRGRGFKKCTDCVCDVSADEPPSQPLSVTIKVRIGLLDFPPGLLLQGSRSHLTEEFHTLEKVSDELRAVQETLNLVLNSRREEGKPGYWTRVTKRINKVFFIFYITVASVFLVVLFSAWTDAEHK
ncbi:5-hydroxytryptamine receptor 3A-like [Plectropomus leopardus]|uniref:5-hydroxytryptamine receptor 3A-like n=1 Tax=Plectropomus leopardus TaxID=160734 RepID=UPI001C4C2DB3|nr:5-hydroxytryptamine receptor 3A-like [Plectropomus leopardus]